MSLPVETGLEGSKKPQLYIPRGCTSATVQALQSKIDSNFKGNKKLYMPTDHGIPSCATSIQQLKAARVRLQMSGVHEAEVAKLAVDEYERLKKSFVNLDTDQDGKVGVDDLRESMVSDGIFIPRSEARDMIWEIVDKPAVDRRPFHVFFTLHELMIAYIRAKEHPRESRRLFNYVFYKMLDVDGDGSVDSDEVFTYVFPKVSLKHLNNYMARLFTVQENEKSGSTVDIPAGKVCGEGFIRILQSRLWNGTKHRVRDQRHTRPRINVDPPKKTAKEIYLESRERLNRVLRATDKEARDAYKEAPEPIIERKKSHRRGGITNKDDLGNAIWQELSITTKLHVRMHDDDAKGVNKDEDSPTITHEERMLMTELATKNGIILQDLEKIFSIFQLNDPGKTGFISRAAFRTVVMNLLKLPDLEESDLDRVWILSHFKSADKVNLDDFVKWYKQYLPQAKNIEHASMKD